jgi:P pilus assembly chaperone PapD
MKSISRVLFSAFLFVSIISSTHALGLSISPLKFEITGAPSTTRSDVIRVTNDTDGPITLYTSKEDFVSGDETGRPKFIASKDQTTDTYSLANWIRLENENLTLAKGETREVRFSVNVPANAEPG